MTDQRSAAAKPKRKSPPKRPSTLEIMPLLANYLRQPGNAMGGSLHLYIDDGNCTNADISFCRDWAITNGDQDGAMLADLLLLMTVTQRRKMYNDLGKGKFMRIAEALARIESDPGATPRLAKEARETKSVAELMDLAERAISNVRLPSS